ncbi:MAG: MAPEG family protein [Pseudomonadota bacterium]
MPLAIALTAVFAQVALTFWAIFQMGRHRLAAIRREGLSHAEIALSAEAYPDRVKQFQANTHNQFETPILLYAGVGLAAGTGSANWGVAAGAALYVATRLWHRQIHVSSNHLPKRFRAYCAGLLALILLWLSLGLGLLL